MYIIGITINGHTAGFVQCECHGNKTRVWKKRRETQDVTNDLNCQRSYFKRLTGDRYEYFVLPVSSYRPGKRRDNTLALPPYRAKEAKHLQRLQHSN